MLGAHTSCCGLQMPPRQGLWSLFDHPFLTHISLFLMSHSLNSRMWFSATTLRKLWVLLPMIQTAASLEAVSLTITLSHETIPRGLLGVKMCVSWSLCGNVSCLPLLSGRRYGFKRHWIFASSWEEKLWGMRTASKHTVTPGWFWVEHT